MRTVLIEQAERREALRQLVQAADRFLRESERDGLVRRRAPRSDIRERRRRLLAPWRDGGGLRERGGPLLVRVPFRIELSERCVQRHEGGVDQRQRQLGVGEARQQQTEEGE